MICESTADTVCATCGKKRRKHFRDVTTPGQWICPVQAPGKFFEPLTKPTRAEEET